MTKLHLALASLVLAAVLVGCSATKPTPSWLCAIPGVGSLPGLYCPPPVPTP